MLRHIFNYTFKDCFYIMIDIEMPEKQATLVTDIEMPEKQKLLWF